MVQKNAVVKFLWSGHKLKSKTVKIFSTSGLTTPFFTTFFKKKINPSGTKAVTLLHGSHLF